MTAVTSLPQSPFPSVAAGRVLVVDDHRQARESIAEVLRHAGHQVACLASAVEALHVLEDETSTW